MGKPAAETRRSRAAVFFRKPSTAVSNLTAYRPCPTPTLFIDAHRNGDGANNDAGKSHHQDPSQCVEMFQTNDSTMKQYNHFLFQKRRQMPEM
jgi:hypothetical protein